MQCECQSLDQGAILGHIIRRGTYSSRKSIDNVLPAIPDFAEYNCNSGLAGRVLVPPLSRVDHPAVRIQQVVRVARQEFALHEATIHQVLAD